VPALNKLRQEKQEASDHNQAKVEAAELKRCVAEQTWARDQRWGSGFAPHRTADAPSACAIRATAQFRCSCRRRTLHGAGTEGAGCASACLQCQPLSRHASPSEGLLSWLLVPARAGRGPTRRSGWSSWASGWPRRRGCARRPAARPARRRSSCRWGPAGHTARRSAHACCSPSMCVCRPGCAVLQQPPAVQPPTADCRLKLR
jgi:hypothetical protein